MITEEKMFQTGLLVLTTPLRTLLTHVGGYLNAARQVVNKKLYIKLEPGLHELGNQNHKQLDQKLLSRIIPAIYCYASYSCANLDVRILQAFTKIPSHQDSHLKCTFEVVLTDYLKGTSGMQEYLKDHFNKECNNVNVLYPVLNDGSIPKYGECTASTSSTELYKKVCLGGTFDRIHNGHKVLLSEAVLRTSRELIVGVTDVPMIQKKVLWELIAPVEERIHSVSEFLHDIDPTVDYRVVSISDPFGPSTEEPDIDCIIVSEETTKGGMKVNEERAKKGFPELKIHTISMLEDPYRNAVEETKVSSSSLRMRLLGTLLKSPIPKPHLPRRPYLIGLTGGIASGKSSVAHRLRQLGAALIDCDRLAHRTYEPGNRVYDKVLEEFGKDILHPDGSINRKAIGTKVFVNESLRHRLNSIVWPEVAQLVDEQIQLHTQNGVSVIVLEVALLIEAGWQDKVHQVWVSIIPETEAVRRIKERDGLSEEQALQRIHSQTSNTKRVKEANIVFSTFWESEYTQLQVEKAWKELQNYLTKDGSKI